MPDLKKRPPKLDPAGRYKGTNYDPDYARKKYGPTAGRRDKGASNLWGQNDDPGYSPYDAGIQTGYRPNTGPGYYGNTGYSNGGSAISGAASSQGGGSFNTPHLDSQGHSDPAGVQIRSEAIYGVRNSTPSIPSSSGISMDLRSQYSPSHWASSHGNAQTGDGSAPIVPSTHDRYSPVASTATGHAGPSSSAVPANPGHAHSSSVGEISSLEKLKQFKAQVEASRLARANAKPDSSVAQAAETYLQSVNTSANATQAAQTQSPTTTTSATNSGPSAQQTEEGETRESRALALKERLRQKIEERKNSVSTGTRTPEPLIAADRPPSSVGAAPANGASVRAPQNSRETWTPSAPSREASSRAPFQQTASPHSPTLPTQHHDTPQRTSKDVVSPAQQAVQAQYQTSPQQVHPHRQALVSSPTTTTEPLLGHSEAQSYALAEWEPQRAPESVSSVAEDVAGRYIEAARKRQEARERVIDSQRRRSLSPRTYYAQRHQSPTSSVPQDHYHWGHSRRERSPVRRPSLADRREYHDARRDEPADRYGTHASPHNVRQDRYAETPPHLSLSSHQSARQETSERIVYEPPAQMAPATGTPSGVVAPTTAWIVKTLQLLKEQVLELEKLIDPAALAAASTPPVSSQAPQPSQVSYPAAVPPASSTSDAFTETFKAPERGYIPPSIRESYQPGRVPPSEYEYSERGDTQDRDSTYKGQYGKPSYKSFKSGYYDKGYTNGSGRGRGGYRGRGGRRTSSTERPVYEERYRQNGYDDYR